MTRQARQTWLLLAAVALLAFAAVAVQWRAQRAAPGPLLVAPPIDIDAIALACAACDGPRRFQRVQGRWRMVAPWDVAADPASIERLLAIPATPVRRRFDALPGDPATLGLAPAFAEVDLDGTRIVFGTTEAIDHARYVRIGDAVALVPDRISVVLLAPAERFVDRDPFADLQRGLVAVTEDDAAWPAARVAALAAWRAEAVEVLAQGATGAGRVLVLRDGTGRDHAFRLVTQHGRPALLRDDRPLAWLMPADAALPD